MSENFYRAFEERYYAPRDLIKEMRRQYLPFVEPLRSLYPGATAYDAGCGRGEWLELMLEHDFSPVGIDLDEGMLSACWERDLPGKKGDAVERLLDFENDSLAVVSAFHVVEHIDFDSLKKFVQRAWLALKPGGLLIMETPNPENIIVATRNFYLDPTHKNPIPAELLSFLAEYVGFERVKTLRLQEVKALCRKNNINITEVLSGVSPDYAIVAQKHAPPEVMSKFDDIFDQEQGLSFDALVSRFDERLVRIEAKAVEANIKANKAEVKAIEAEVKAIEIEARMVALLNSRSWRITAPFRWLSKIIFDSSRDN